MFNFLTVIEPDARAEHLQAYRDYLLERDGACDLDARSLSHRDAQMKRFENVTPRHSLDRALFEAQYANFDAARPTSKEMLLLLTLLKLNAAEAYGVEATFDLVFQRAKANPDDQIEMRLLIEEHYHTRILLSAAREYGLEVSKTFRPTLSMRGLIGGISAVPLHLVRPVVLASELVGTLMFAQAFVRAGEVLADKPELRDAIQERLVEILVDEIGHVTFNQLMLGSWGMFQARRMFPMVALGLRNMNGEWRELGVNSTTDLSWFKRMPESVMQRAFAVREVSASRGHVVSQSAAAE